MVSLIHEHQFLTLEITSLTALTYIFVYTHVSWPDLLVVCFTISNKQRNYLHN